MTTVKNRSWKLESFVDSFVHELDNVHDTLSVKGVTRKLSYTVQDVSLDLNIFPQYHDGKVTFLMAKPGQTGSSKLSMQLGSISSRQIKEMAKKPIDRSDISVDDIDGLDDDTRQSLKKVGISSVNDFERLENLNVNVEKIINDKSDNGKVDDKSDELPQQPSSARPTRKKSKKKKINYGDLANLISKSRRKQLAPSLSKISITPQDNNSDVILDGSHLVLSQSFTGFPIAVINDQQVEIVNAKTNQLKLSVPNRHLKSGSNKLKIALDPFALMVLEIKQ